MSGASNSEDMVSAVTSDGVKLLARVCGSGVPLVFVHEFSGDARSWDPQVAFFGRYFHCISYNARGYPPSDVPLTQDAYSQDRAVEDIADVMSAVGIESAHIIGLSMGAFATLHFGLKYPERARSLVVAGCGAGAKPEQQQQFALNAAKEADRAEAIGMSTFAREFVLNPYAHCLRAKTPQAWAVHATHLAEHSVQGMAMTLRGVLARRPSLWHIEEKLRGLRVPTLLLAGDEDDGCLEPSLFLKRTIPDAALCILPRSGHLINVEEPKLFNDAVFNFLLGVDSGRWRDLSGHKFRSKT